MVAFEEGSPKPPVLVKIGERIVEKCYNLPLAIKVLGTLLYHQPIDKWQSFETNGFAGICRGDNEVMTILKFSYDHLEPSLKSCFAYCAVFPKDFVLNKEMLLNIWEAQGYIVPFHEGQSIENAAEEHFSILAKRCFFKDVQKNEYGEVVSFKIHDLMYDLAQKISGSETCVSHSDIPKLEHGVRHLFQASGNVNDTHIIESNIRSFLWFKDSEMSRESDRSNPIEKIAMSWLCLRVLALEHLNIASLPDTVANLLHLRYLNLANSSCKILPKSIIQLYNLQTLNLNNCESFKEWPKNFSKLVNLRHLYLDNCNKLKYMPFDVSKMSGLRALTRFVVKDESEKGKERVGQLKDLKDLAENLTGRISINFRKCFKTAENYNWEGSCMEGAEHLKEMKIHFSGLIYISLSLVYSTLKGDIEGDEETGVTEEAVMEKLRPHPNLRKFELHCYVGEKIGSWGRSQDNWATCLPNLVHIVLWRCHRLKQLPLLSKLLHLKHLHLYELWELEYMEEEVTSSNSLGSSDSSESETEFFPSLKSLEIDDLKNLKGWWRHDSEDKRNCQPAFPRLSQLTIQLCCKLTSFPPCPRLQKLHLKDVDKALKESLSNIPTLSTEDDI